MIPKPKMVYRIDVYHPKARFPFDIKFVEPKNIKYWLTADFTENEDFWTVNTCMVSPEKWAEIISVP